MATSWLSHYSQYRTQQHEHDIAKREDLYKEFIEEASRLYGDACEHNEVSISKLVGISALINRMRVLSSPEIIEKADNVMSVIIETYVAPTKTLHDVAALVHNRELGPMRAFSNACRDELRRLGSS